MWYPVLVHGDTGKMMIVFDLCIWSILAFGPTGLKESPFKTSILRLQQVCAFWRFFMVTEHDWMELRGIFLVDDLFMETFRCFRRVS